MPRDKLQSDMERKQTLSERSIEVCNELLNIMDNQEDALGEVCADAANVIQDLQNNLRVTRKQLMKAVTFLRVEQERDDKPKTAAMRESRAKLMNELTATINRLKQEVLT